MVIVAQVLVGVLLARGLVHLLYVAPAVTEFPWTGRG